ncbi:pimeloyl-ACP methyl ester carboxylesterase [Aeromicrobium panaciterrae]|uniref:Pimeloyl-ACP methyl ester carboxylesterase n=1 Tax=Aeromicrobium panaciterrae TaxID=363861 RepID=A0ABU1UM65_9ACTN|nr:alpha/beta hydrolase [Aeromicrobium panaciterrae]MDR7086273.1 pimeloyl-ACP methyl ester carboxylesterase [Aeromicrobium panaciterrae]
MSIPKTLEIPSGVEAVTIHAEGTNFAAHIARIDNPRGHILLVPGWTGSKEDFTQVLPLLAAAGFDVTAYDQRGQYETVARPDDDFTLAGFARDAIAVAKAASPAPTHLLGHSFGGLVAQRAAVDSPASWRSLSLLGTGPGALGESPHRPLKMLLQALGKVPLLQIHEVREQGVRRPAQITRFLAKRFTSNSVPSLKAITQLLLDAPDIIDQVKALDLPIWVGRGQDDDAWGHDVQASMAERLGTAVHVIGNSVHSPGVENPEGLVEAWLPFLNSHS